MIINSLHVPSVPRSTVMGLGRGGRWRGGFRRIGWNFFYSAFIGRPWTCLSTTIYCTCTCTCTCIFRTIILQCTCCAGFWSSTWRSEKDHHSNQHCWDEHHYRRCRVCRRLWQSQRNGKKLHGYICSHADGWIEFDIIIYFFRPTMQWTSWPAWRLSGSVKQPQDREGEEQGGWCSYVHVHVHV